MGTIGGVYEIIYLFFSLIFKIFVDNLFKSVFIKTREQESNEKEWFSFPASLALSQMSRDQSYKVANLEEEEKIPNLGSIRDYQSYDQIEPEVRYSKYIIIGFNTYS